MKIYLEIEKVNLDEIESYLRSSGCPSQALRKVSKPIGSNGSKFQIDLSDASSSYVVRFAIKIAINRRLGNLCISDSSNNVFRLHLRGDVLMPILEHFISDDPIDSIAADSDYITCFSVRNGGSSIMRDFDGLFELSGPSGKNMDRIYSALSNLLSSQIDIRKKEHECQTFMSAIDHFHFQASIHNHAPIPGGRRQYPHPPDVVSNNSLNSKALTLDINQNSGNSRRPFIEVLNGRHSTINFTDTPLELAQLSELLANSIIKKPSLTNHTTELHAGERYYPAAGGMYENMFFLTQFHNSDLPKGIYLYDPVSHSLKIVNSDICILDAYYENLKKISNAEFLSGCISIAADYKKFNSRYEEISGSLIEKNVGVIISHLYMAASCASIGICCLGVSSFPDKIVEQQQNSIVISDLIIGSLKPMIL